MAFMQDKEAIEVVFMAKNGRDVVRMAEKHKPDVILMDQDLKLMRGDVATGVIRKKIPTTKVLAVTMHDDERSIASFIRNNCNGFIAKGDSLNEVVHALYNLEIRDFYYNKYITRPLRSKVLGKTTNEPEAQLVKLTRREKEVIFHISQQLTYQEIGSLLNISKRTVERHVENVMHKTGMRNIVGLALYGYRNGYFC